MSKFPMRPPGTVGALLWMLDQFNAENRKLSADVKRLRAVLKELEEIAGECDSLASWVVARVVNDALEP